MQSNRNFSELSFETKALLFTHLSVMEKAGLSTESSFANLRLQGKAQQRVAATIRNLKRGKSIAQAGRTAGLFDQLESHVIEAATQAGSPAITYKRFADHYTEKDRLQKLVKSRMRLPIVMFLMSLFIAPLSAFATGAISGSAYLWKALSPLLLVFLIWKAIQFLRNTYRAQAYEKNNPLDRLALQLPLFGRMNLRANANQFYESLGLMLEAGMPIFDALPLATQTIHNSVIRAEFSSILPQLHEGKTLSQALEKLNFVGQMHIIELVRTGESSGTIPEMLWRYSSSENQAISLFHEEVAAWVPRILYTLVAIWMIIGIFKSNAFVPQMPEGL